MKKFLIKRQLIAQGSESREAKELSELAVKISKMPVPHLSLEAKDAIASQIGLKTHHKPLYPRLAMAGGMAVIAVVVIFAQHVSPSSPLYEIKKLTGYFEDKIHTRNTYHPPYLPKTEPHLTPIVLPSKPSANPDSKNASQATNPASEQSRSKTPGEKTEIFNQSHLSPSSNEKSSSSEQTRDRSGDNWNDNTDKTTNNLLDSL